MNERRRERRCLLCHPCFWLCASKELRTWLSQDRDRSRSPISSFISIRSLTLPHLIYAVLLVLYCPSPITLILQLQCASRAISNAQFSSLKVSTQFQGLPNPWTGPLSKCNAIQSFSPQLGSLMLWQRLSFQQQPTIWLLSEHLFCRCFRWLSLLFNQRTMNQTIKYRNFLDQRQN